MKVHVFPTKEKLLAKSRLAQDLPAPYNGVHFYADLSKYTLNWGRQIKMITKALNNHKSLYKGRHPATVVITRNGMSHTVANPNDGYPPFTNP